MRRPAKPENWAGVLVRVLLVGSLAWLLGLSLSPQALQQARLDYAEALRAGEPAQAADSLERVAVFFSWRGDFLAAAARYRLQAGDLAGVSPYLDLPAVRAAFSGEDWLRLGDAYLAAGDPESAEAAWQGGLLRDASLLDLHDRLHNLYRSQGDYLAAARSLRAVLVLRPNEPGLAYQLGLYLAALQPSEALVYLELAKRDAALESAANELQRTIRTAELEDEPAYTCVQTGRQLARLGEWALAGESFRQAVLQRPDYSEAWALLSEARQQVGGNPAQAWADLEQALRLKPDSALVNSLAALYWERQGGPEKMVGYLATAAQAEPQNAAWQAEWGRALALSGDLQAAQAHYETAVQLAPQEVYYLRLLAEFSLRHQVNVENLGAPAARRALALLPGDAATLDVLGQVYLALGNLPLAERFLRQAVLLQPGEAPAWLHLGVLYLYRGEAEWGYTLLHQARELALPGSTAAVQAQRLLAQYFP